MGRKTGVQWADASWGPWRGCTKVSEGCRFCYGERDMTRYGRDFSVVTRANAGTFRSPVHWKEGLRVFVCPWGDFFHPAADTWRDEAWAVIEQSPQHTFLILTKRPERIGANTLPVYWGRGWSHVWLGVTAENQQAADLRIPLLAAVPAAHRFLSAEPLLEPLDLRNVLGNYGTPEWVVIGGESGPKARPMEVNWLYSITDQCDAAGVAVFVKQDSGPRSGQQGSIPADLWRRKECPGASR
jgi:protein gp37